MKKDRIASASHNFCMPVFSAEKFVFCVIYIMLSFLTLSILATTNTFAQNANSYTSSSMWCTDEGAQMYTGDYNGDGKTDLMCKDDTNVWISYADANGYVGEKSDWHEMSTWCAYEGAQMYTGDYNGDAKTDLMCMDGTGVWISYADDNGYVGIKPDWEGKSSGCRHEGAQMYMGDYNGDGKTDLMCKDDTNVWISYADTNGYVGEKSDWHEMSTWCTHEGAQMYMGDYNGDAKTDLMCMDGTGVWISYADDNGHVGAKPDWEEKSSGCAHEGAQMYMGDYNGDGQTDLMCKDDTDVWVSYADASGHVGKTVDWHEMSTWCTHEGAQMYMGDYNGNGKTDHMCKDGTNIEIVFDPF